MREHALPLEPVPFFLQFTYSLCLHAAVVSLIVSLPVFGGSGRPPGQAYVVTLAGHAHQPPQGNDIEIAVRRQPAGKPVGDMPADVVPSKKEVTTGGLDGTGKSRVAEQVQLPDAADAARATTSVAVTQMPSAAQPVPVNPSPKPDLPDAIADPEPESVAVIPPMALTDKTVIVEPDHMVPPEEIIPPVPDRKPVPSKTTSKQREKSDVSSSEDANAPFSETRHKDHAGQSDTAGKQARTAAETKGGFAGSRASAPSGPASGSETSSKKGWTGAPAKSAGPAGSGAEGNADTRNMTTGTSPGSGKGYEVTSALNPNQNKPKKNEIKETREELPAIIQLPDALLVRDIKIEVVAEKKALSDISMDLSIRVHPANRKKHAKDVERKIEDTEITTSKGGPGASGTKTLTLRKAEQGVYIFSLTSTGDVSSVGIVFSLYARTEQERKKEYYSIFLTPATVTKFMFLMPESLFWDDTERFSGSIEDSHSVTKFRNETGLLWKEEKR